MHVSQLDGLVTHDAQPLIVVQPLVVGGGGGGVATGRASTASTSTSTLSGSTLSMWAHHCRAPSVFTVGLPLSSRGA